MENVLKCKWIEKRRKTLIKCKVLEGITIINNEHDNYQRHQLGFRSTKIRPTSGVDQTVSDNLFT